jgi:hypothetical protein
MCAFGGSPVSSTTFDVDLCGQVDNHDPIGTSCPPANGEDRIFVLPFDRARRVVIDAEDADIDVAVDPVIYLLDGCADSDTIVCNDDRPGGGRSARIDGTFGPGEIFLVVDSYMYRDPPTDYVCGNVRVTISYP